MWTEHVQHTVLDNGVTVLAYRDAAAPVLSVVTHVRAGYLNEPDSVVGISHVLEHMYFKHGSIADDIQRLGGYVNAGTIYDKTVYYAVIPSAPGVLRDTVKLQANALTGLAIDADELRRELEVIIQEANRKKDSPNAVAIETLYASLYAQHRLRRWRIGTEEQLRDFTPDDLQRFYDAYYTPDRTIVAIVGDVDLEEALETAALEFGQWSSTSHAAVSQPQETHPPPATFRLLHGDVSRAVTALGWRTSGGLTNSVAALDMAAAVLGAGKGSLLGRGIREQGMASSAVAHHYTLADVGVFDVFIEGAVSTADDAISEAVGIIRAVGSSGLDEDDLNCAKALTSSRWSRRLETTDGRASMLCEFEALGGFHLMDEWYSRIMDVSVDQIREATSRHLDISELSGVMYAPTDTSSRFLSTSWPPVIESRPVESAPLPSRPVTPDPSAMFPERSYPEGVVHVDLPGVDLILKSKRGTGLAFLGIYADSMRAAEPDGQAGISSLLLRSGLRGAAGLSSGEMSRFAESLGGSVVPLMMLGWIGWGLNVRVETLREALDLLIDIARNPTLDTAMFETERALLDSDAARAKDDMSGYPMRRVLQSGLSGAWYGAPVLGEPGVVGKIPRDAVEAWAESLRKRRLTVIVVGDASVDELRHQTSSLQRWPTAARQPTVGDPFRWKSCRDVESRDKAQSAIAMAFPAGSYHSPDRFPLTITSAILGGLAGRLFKELRDELSLAYSVSASSWFRIRAGALLTYIATSPAREDEARQEMLASLSRFVSNGFSEDELIRARNYAAGQVQLRRQSTYAIASEILASWLYGDLEDLENVPNELRAVTEDQVMEVAQRILTTEARAEFTLRGGVT